jgi:RHS repeat-associated protein
VDSFTGKPDQLVPDEYDFPAREEHNGQGRWTSPDPMRGTGNKYVYADNNPLSKVDIYGMYTVSIEGIDTSVDGTLDAAAYSIAESHPLATVQTNGQVTGTPSTPAASASTQTPQSHLQAQAQTQQINGLPVQEAQNQSSGCGWCQKLFNGVRGAGWRTDQQIAQEAINSGEPPNGEYSFVFGRSCPDCKYYPKEVVEAVNAHEDQHAKDEHTVAGFEKLFSKQGQRELELNAFKAELGVENSNIGALEGKGSARTPMDDTSLIILRNMRDQAQGVIDTGAKIYIP